MSVGLQVWSQTASANSTSDTNINWAEGMAPSQVNDSARALMASMAKWRDDNNGTLVTSGSSSAYTIATSNQVSTGLVDGYTVTAKFHAANAASATLSVDGNTAKGIQVVSGTAVSSGVILANSIQKLKYESGSTGWVLQSNNNVQSLTADNVAVNGLTYATIQAVSASRLLGNPTGSSTNVQEISLGTNLTFSGTTLNAGNNTPVVTTITSTATTTWQSTTQNGNFPLYLRVRMVGGGGGGGAEVTNAGTAGTTTIFNNWTAIPGSGGTANAGNGAIGGTGGANGTGTLITRVNGQSGSQGGNTGTTFYPGGFGGNSFFGGGGWRVGNGAGEAAQANTGSGGQGGTGNSGSNGGGGGGAGEFVEFIVTSPSTAYTVQVGAGGTGGTAGGNAGGNGAAGRIEVIAYWQ